MEFLFEPDTATRPAGSFAGVTLDPAPACYTCRQATFIDRFRFGFNRDQSGNRKAKSKTCYDSRPK
jgi:hypothetical protein